MSPERNPFPFNPERPETTNTPEKRPELFPPQVPLTPVNPYVQPDPRITRVNPNPKYDPLPPAKPKP